MKNKISEKKLFMMLSTELFAMTSLILPAILVGFSGKNGIPVLLVASGLLFLLTGWYLTCYRRREKSPDQVLEEKNGWGKAIFKGIYIVRYFLHGLFLMIIFVNLIQEVLLPEYAHFWILLPLLLLVFMMEGKQLRVRGRILEVLFPYIFLPLFAVLFLALFQLDYSSLPEQLWGTFHQETGKTMAYAVYGTLLFYQPIEFLLFLLPALEETKKKKRKKRLAKVAAAACLFVIAVNLMMYVSAVGMFGTVRTGEKLWSALYIMQNVRLPGKFVERLDILFLVFWVFSAFSLISAYLYYGSRFVVPENLKDESQRERGNGDRILNGKKSRWYTILWIAGILLLTLLIRTPQRMFQFFLPYKMWVDFPLAVVLPFLIYSGKGKKKGRKGMKVAVSVFLCACIITGCQDRAAIEDRNYVMALGVEKGQKKQFHFIYEIADLSQASKDGTGRKGIQLSYEADSLEEALQTDRLRSDKKMDFGHLKAILFPKKLMEKEAFRTEILKELEQFHSIAGTTQIFFTEEKMESVMETGEKKAASFGEYMEQMMTNQKKGTVKKDTLGSFLRDESEKNRERNICMIKIAGEQLELQTGRLESAGEEKEAMLSQAEISYGDESIRNSIENAVLRFHIRANSDAVPDQEKKRAVKDRILPKLQALLAEAGSKEECVSVITQSLDQIENWVDRACEQEKCSYKGNVYLCRESFPLKTYGNLLLPSGVYDALRIDLGRAEGANWWCMMYPSLCFSDGVMGKITEEGEEVLEETLEEEEYESVFFEQKEKKVSIRWKIGEWFSHIWSEYF